MSPRAKDIKERINKWDLIKIKTSAQLKKKNHQQNEKGANHMGKLFANDTSDKGLISKIYKELT